MAFRRYALEAALLVGLVALGLQLSLLAVDWLSGIPRPGRQVLARVTNPALRGLNSRGWVYLPCGYGGIEKGWPLVLFLHGSGERGQDASMVLKHGLPNMLANGWQTQAIVVSPQCLAGYSWEAETVTKLAIHCKERFSVDPRRVVLVGFSMGGAGALEAAAAAPGSYAAVLAVAGTPQTPDIKALRQTPTRVVHDKDDPVVPFSASEDLVAALLAAGADAELIALSGRGHAVSTVLSERPGLMGWALRQRLLVKPSGGLAYGSKSETEESQPREPRPR